MSRHSTLKCIAETKMLCNRSSFYKGACKNRAFCHLEINHIFKCRKCPFENITNQRKTQEIGFRDDLNLKERD
jgi:hypothetical protein